MQEPIIKKKPKQEPSPFSKNIQAYIFANNLNRQDFADLINAYMAAYPDRGKIYSNNDVWTYERRGSLPKDMRALVAIAKIMGKPLEEVLTTVIPAEQFAPPRRPPQPPVSALRQLSQIDPPFAKEREWIAVSSICPNRSRGGMRRNSSGAAAPGH